jgi:hypothetical protein
MPTPDASAFTSLKKYRAIDNRGFDNGSPKKITHLYNWVPSATASNKFLPSFSNKITSTLRVTRINYDTAPKSKTGGVGACSAGGGGVGTQF